MITYETRNDLIDILPKDLVVAELGVFRGEFSNEIYNRMHPSHLYLVDIWEGTMGSGDKDGQNHVTIHNMEEVYHQIKDKYIDTTNIEVIRSRSLDFLNSKPNDSFDMIYIDADHHYAAVKADLITSYHKLKDGGYLLGHDYIHNPYEPAVIEAVTEFCNEYNQTVEALTKDGCPSFLIKVKK
jgi:hypothetical protein